MLFPIGDDQVKGGQFPIFSYVFIFANIAVFLFLQIPNDVFTYSYSTVPYEITKGVDLVGWVICRRLSCWTCTLLTCHTATQVSGHAVYFTVFGAFTCLFSFCFTL